MQAHREHQQAPPEGGEARPQVRFHRSYALRVLRQVTAEHHKLRNGKTRTTYRCSNSWKRCTKRGISLELLGAALAEKIGSIQLNEHYVAFTFTTEAKKCRLVSDTKRLFGGIYVRLYKPLPTSV